MATRRIQDLSQEIPTAAAKIPFDNASGETKQNSPGEHVLAGLTEKSITPRKVVTFATRPGITNDDGEGYGAGDMWIYAPASVPTEIHICRDPSTGAAVWDLFAPQAAGGSAATTIEARKATAGTINKGEAVRVVGYASGFVTVELADADASGQEQGIGIAAATITDAAEGDVALAGTVDGLNTSAFSAGDRVYVGTTAGALVDTRPNVEQVWRIGTVIRSDASDGVISISPEPVPGRHYVYLFQDNIAAATEGYQYFGSDKSGTLESVGMLSSKFPTPASSAGNKWQFDLLNASAQSLLASPYDTDPAENGDWNWGTWTDISENGLNADTARLDIVAGQIFNFTATETGTAPSMGDVPAIIRMVLIPLN